MLAITRTRTPEDTLFDLPKAHPRSIPRSQPHLSTPKSQPDLFAPRIGSFGSVSSTDTDPFPDLMPWEALFEAQIHDSPTGIQRVPSDVSDSEATNTMSMVIDMARLLDPTTLAFGFQQTYLSGLDDALLYSPLEAFASTCWESTTESRAREEGVPSTSTSYGLDAVLDEDSTLDLEDALCSPMCPGREVPIQVPISASLLWSDDSDDSDEDECRTYHDDYTPVATIHDNDSSLVRVHPVGDFSPIEKEKNLYYRDLTASFGTFEPLFPSFSSDLVCDPIGQSPVPKVVAPAPPHPSKSVPKRIAAFCARFPAVVSAAVVR